MSLEVLRFKEILMFDGSNHIIPMWGNILIYIWLWIFLSVPVVMKVNKDACRVFSCSVPCMSVIIQWHFKPWCTSKMVLRNNLLEHNGIYLRTWPKHMCVRKFHLYVYYISYQCNKICQISASLFLILLFVYSIECKNNVNMWILIQVLP